MNSDKTLQLLLEYTKQNNEILRANNDLLQEIRHLEYENSLLLKYIKQEIDKEFSLENLIKVESVIFIFNIIADLIGSHIYHGYIENK